MTQEEKQQLIDQIKFLIGCNDKPTEIDPNLLQYFDEDELIAIRDNLLQSKKDLHQQSIKWLDELYEKTK